METVIRLDLMESGTRYDHYMELRDAFATGVEVLKHTLTIHPSVSDLLRLKKLEGAVEVINSRVNYLSEFERKTASFSDLVKEINKIQPHRTEQIAEVSESTRLACEKELADAATTGYRRTDEKDNSTEGTQGNQGTQTI